MSDVFISYAHEDKAAAARLAKVLARQWSVYWDRDQTRGLKGGAKWRAELQSELRSARCVLVLWSEHSARSDFVPDEASRAKDRGALIPVRIDDVEVPLGFGEIQTIDLRIWDGTEGSAQSRELLEAIEQMLASRPTDSGEPPASEPVGGMPKAWQTARRKRMLQLAAGILVATLLGAAGYWGYQQRGPELLASGKFVDSQNQPVAVPGVTIFLLTDDLKHKLAETVTAADGSFELYGERPKDDSSEEYCIHVQGEEEGACTWVAPKGEADIKHKIRETEYE